MSEMRLKKKLNLIGRVKSYFGYFIGFACVVFGTILIRFDAVFIGVVLMLISYLVNRSLQKENQK